jgi:hypothetical protein
MSTVSDVRYAQLQYEENRSLGEDIRKHQDGLDQKRGRMGLGRTLLSFAGGAIGASGGPVGMAIGAGLGSALGSFLGGASTGKIDEIEKGKLYKATADEARRQGRDAQTQMNEMAVRGALTDAASAFFFAGTDLGKAAQSGATGKVAGLGADAGLLRKAWASGSGAVAGGAGHIKGGILNAMRPEATTPVIPELTELQGGDIMGDYLKEGLPGRMALPSTDLVAGAQQGLEDVAFKSVETGTQGVSEAFSGALDQGYTPWSSPDQVFAEAAERGVAPVGGYRHGAVTYQGPDISGANIRTQRTHQLSPQLANIQRTHQLPPQLTNIAQNNARRTTVPLADAMQSEDWMSSLTGFVQSNSLSSRDQPGYWDALAQFRANRDQYGRAIAGGG